MNEEKLPSWDEMVAANRQEGATPSWDEMVALEQQQAAKQNRGLAGDLVTDFKRGVQQIPGALTGLADVPYGLVLGWRPHSQAFEKMGEVTGFQPGKWAEEAKQEYSPARQRANAEVDAAEGFVDSTAAYLRNPSTILGVVAESIPGMGVAGKGAQLINKGLGLMKPATTVAGQVSQAALLGKTGESAMAAGMTMDELGDKVDPRTAALASLGVGATTFAGSHFGSKAAERMGVVDVDTAFAGGGLRTAADGVEGATQRGLLSRVAGGAVAEGAFEEMPQSAAEQMWQNWAEDDPIFQGVGKAMAGGLLAGGLMGGAFNIPGQSRVETQPTANKQEVPYNQMPSEQPALPGMPVPEPEPGVAEASETRSAQELLEEYRELRAQALAPEVRQRPELGQQLAERAKQLRQELGAQGVPWQVVDPAVMENRINTLETGIRKGLDQYKNVLLSDPEKAPKLAESIRGMQSELEQFEPFLEKASTQGSFDFGDAPTVKAPKVKTSAPTDLLGGNDGSRNRVAPNAGLAQNGSAVQGAQPVGSAGNLAPVPAVGSGGGVDAGASVPGTAASAPAGVSSVANTSLIEGTNVSAPVQMAAPAAETNAAETGAQQAAAPAVTAGQPQPANPAQPTQAQPADRVESFKQSSGVKRTDKRIGQFLQELDTARDSGQITQEEHAEYEQKLADAWKQKNKAAVTAHNAVAKDYATKVQERTKPANIHQVATQSVPDEQRFVQNLMGSLSPQERRVLELYHFDKQTMEDIGDTLSNEEGREKAYTRARIQQIHAAAVGKIKQAATQLGVSPERIDAYFGSENNSLQGGADVQTVSAAELAQSGAAMHTPGAATNPAQQGDDVPVADAASNLGAEAGLVGEFVESDQFDAEPGEQATDDLEESYADEDSALAAIMDLSTDFEGEPITPETIAAAEQAWEDLDGTTLHASERAKWVQTYIAYNKGAINDSQYGQIYSEISTDNEIAKGEHRRDDTGAKEPSGVRLAQEGDKSLTQAESTEVTAAKDRRKALFDEVTGYSGDTLGNYEGVISETKFNLRAYSDAKPTSESGAAGIAKAIAETQQKLDDLAAIKADVWSFAESRSLQQAEKDLLRSAKQELDAAVRTGQLSQERANEVVNAARRTGDATAASETVLSAVDGAEPTNPIERRVADLLPQLGERQAAAVSKLVRKFQGGEISLERLGDELQNYEDQVSEEVKYSRAAKPQGTTERDIRAQLQGLFHSKSRFDAKVTVFATAADVPVELRDQAAVDASIDAADAELEGVQGFVSNGKVYLIAENIAPGKELAVFLHEVGVHLGMKNLLGQDNYDKLVEQIKTWAESRKDTQEAQLARKALYRIMDAEEATGEDMSQPDFDDELIAYFVEEAVLAGINPQALAKVRGPMAQWFRTLWASVKAALRKFGLDRVDTLTAQNLVDMAYGAARLEMEGTWHGTAADFRNFSHEYMGTGEGAQAFGWGTYLAQRLGIAKGYWKDDVGRKTDLLYKGEAIKQPFQRGEEPSDLDVALSAVRDVLFGSAYGKQMRSAGKLDAETLKGTIADAQYQLMVNGDTAAYNVLENVKPEDFSFGAAEGSLMRVDVAVAEDEMLDWDKPAYQQGEKVVMALLTAKDELGKTFDGTGKEVYRQMERHFGSDKAASEYLDSTGIKGIKFLDSQSRGPRYKYEYVAGVEYGGLVHEHAAAKVDLDTGKIVALDRYSTEARARAAAVEKDSQYAKERDAPRTRNLVIFNDKNIQRIATQVGADRNRVKFSIAPGKELAYGAADLTLEGESVGSVEVAGQGELSYATKHKNGRKRVSPNAPGAVPEVGSTLAATDDEVLRYYADVKEGEEISDGARLYDAGTPGLEVIDWGPDSTFGPYGHIFSSGEAQGDGSLYFFLTTPQALQAARSLGVEYGHRSFHKQTSLMQVMAFPVRDNVWGIGIQGPEVNTLAFDIADEVGGVNTLPDPDPRSSDPYTRLEGIPAADRNELLKEVRRRITRYQGGRVPNIVFVRETGANVGKRGAVPSDVVKRKFSIARPQLPTFAEATDRVNDILIQAKDGLDKLKLGFLTLEQLSWQSKSDKVKAYVSTMTKIQERAQGIVELASKIDQEWAGLSDKDSAALSKLMLASTKAGYDPSVKGAKPEGAEQTMIQQAFNDLKRRTQDNTGRSVAAELYSKVRDFYKDRYEQRRAILMDAANKAKLNGRDMEKIKELYNKVPQPYFPMMRIGNYYAVGMSPRLAALEAKHKEGTITQGELAERGRLRKQEQHYITSSYDTLAEAQRAVRSYQQAGMTAYANEAKEQLTQAAVKLPGFAQMEAYMKAEVPDAALRDQLTGLFTKMVLEMTPENSAMKSMLKREGIAGAHQDMRQVFAKSAITQAHYISRLEYNHQLMGDLAAVMEEGEGANIAGKRIYNELVARTKLAAEVEDHPIVDKLMNASYLAHLGASPAYWLLNATQVPMITFPWLGARFGFGRSSTALALAFKDAKDIIVTTVTQKDGWRSDINWSKRFGKDSNEHKLLEEMNQRNLLSITMEHDLGATARMGGSKYGLGSFAKLVNTPVRLIEYANRATTALAAYRLEMAKSGNHDEAVEVAAKAVSMTQLNYSGLNTPRHMQSVLGSKTLARMMMQFRKFQQGMLYLTVSSINDAIRATGKDAAETKQLRMEARKTLLGLFATTGVMAGTLGTPMFATVAALANAIANAGGDDDEPWDFETEMRNFYADVLGKDVGLAFAKGLPAAFGVDLSKRVGMGDIGSPLPFVRAGDTTQATAGNIALGLGGAPVGMMVGIADGMSMVAGGDVLKGVEKVAPLKLVKDIGKSIRYGDEGMTDRNGNVILSNDQFDPWDLTLRAMGFGTTKETEYYDANNAVQTAKEAATSTRNKLLRKYAEARLANEPLGDIQAEITEFNQRHPQKGVRIDASSMLRSVQNRRNMAQERDGSGVRAGKANAPYLDNARFALGT